MTIDNVKMEKIKMNFNTLHEIFVLTATRSIKRQYRYFILDRARLSEPEIRHVMAKILEEKKIYQDTERYIDIQQQLHDGVQFSLIVEIQSEKFIEFQKDLINEFVADFVD